MNKTSAIVLLLLVVTMHVIYSAEDNEAHLADMLQNLRVADLNQKDFDDLNDATKRDDDNAMRRLLDKGVIDGNSWVNNDRSTLLMMVACENKKRVTSLLLSYDNTDVNMCDANGWTALILAAGVVDKDMIHLLISNGAHINARNNTNDTALIVATNRNAKNNIIALLSYDNLNVNVCDDDGNSALDTVLFHYYQEQDSNEKQILQEIIHRLLNHRSNHMNLRYLPNII